jgi:acetoacetyl-CoA synthetase
MSPLWTPASARIEASHLHAFGSALAREHGITATDYEALHRFSISEIPAFWRAVWQYAGIDGDPGRQPVMDLDRMPGARFFPDGRINFAANLLRAPSAGTAIVAVSEDGRRRELTFGELERAVRRAAGALRASGVKEGDRVAGVMANVPEAIVAALAAAAIGAVWSSCSPDFGVRGILDRFGQITPTVLVGVDGYVYGGKRFDCLRKIADVAAQLPTVRQVVIVPFAGGDDVLVPNATAWDAWLDRGAALDGPFERFPFNEPLYILYSSGTTGVPKCIVHGAGGTLIQHLKEHQLHCDVKRGDRVFYFTTCGWMMWNWLVTALASGATLILYDGSPFHPDGNRLFDLADETGVTLFGTSAKFVDAVNKAGLRPRETHDLGSLRTITSTGSPLSPESFDFVYEHIKQDVHLASISGGTDIVSCFVGGVPTAPVWRGEIQGPSLGMAVDVFDPDGRPIRDLRQGELVCVRPFPSMPVSFWNDPGGRKYHAAYFDRFPGVWCHGDWMRFTEHGGTVISGRSDATLNPGGVRIGTAEIYRQVERLPEILESLAIGQEWQGDERIVLFVRLREALTLDDALRRRIAAVIREHTSPRHVPARIVEVADIPRTRSGKIVELAVSHVVHGRDVKNREALANPEALELFRDLEALRT